MEAKNADLAFFAGVTVTDTERKECTNSETKRKLIEIYENKNREKIERKSIGMSTQNKCRQNVCCTCHHKKRKGAKNKEVTVA